MKECIACLDPSRMRLLLTGDLPPNEIAAAESHLSTCDVCREEMETQVGADDFWDDVRDSLTDPQYDDGGEEANGKNPMRSMLDLLSPSDDPAMLGRFGSYEVAGILGVGGMGVVFKGFDRALNRYVAIKMLLPHLSVSGAARKRFAREAQAAAAVVDDHVMAIHSVSEWQGVPYFVMNYSRGTSLQTRLSNEGPLELCEILRIGMQSAKGLAAAHAQGLVHRDVKPANIFLDEGVERVQLMDFGLARAADDASLTRSGMLAGTPQFMSPEQTRAEKVDQKSDLFSLGSVMYAMCTGRVPFRAESSYAVLRQITDNEPRPIRQINPSIPEWLCKVIDRLMAKDANDRYESAAEVAELLQRCIGHVQQPDEIALPAEIAPQVNSSSKGGLGTWKWIAAAACFAGLIVFAMFAAAKAIPPDIGGVWTGEDWGDVSLIKTESGKYSGDYTGAKKQKSGTIELSWSRREQRYVGQWRADAGQPSGTLSIRLVENEIRGAWNTRRGNTDGKRPRLSDLTWARSVMPASPMQFTDIKANLSQIDKGLSGYYTEHDRFPPSVILTDGKPPHSWRVAILPYIGEQALYDSYRFDEPWDSEHNRSLLTRMPKCYRSPMDKVDSTNTSYFGMVNQNRHVIPFAEFEKTDSKIRYWFPQQQAVPIGLSFFGKHEGVPVSYMLDGPANVIAIVEAQRPVPWTKPADLEFNFEEPASIANTPTWFPDGWYVAYGDGKVDFVRSTMEATQLRNLFSTWESPDSGFTLSEYRKFSPDWNSEKVKNLASPPDVSFVASPKNKADAGKLVARVLGLIGQPESADSMQNLTKHLSSGFKTGFRITGVIDGSLAAEQDLQVEDILLGVERWQTGTVEDIGYAVRHAKLQELEEAKYYIFRNGQTYYGSFDLATVSWEEEKPTSQPLFQGQSLDVWQSRFVNEVDPNAKIEAAIALVSMTDHLSDEDKISTIIGVGKTVMKGGWLTDQRLRVQAFDNACEPSQTNASGWWAAADHVATLQRWRGLLKVSAAILAAIPVDLLTEELVNGAAKGDGATTAFIVNLLQQDMLQDVIRSDAAATKRLLSDLKRDDDVMLRRALFVMRAVFSATSETHRGTLRQELDEAAQELANGKSHVIDYAFAEECFALAGKFRSDPEEERPRMVGELLKVKLFGEPTQTMKDVFLHEWYADKEFVYSQVLLKRLKARTGWCWDSWMKTVVETLGQQRGIDSIQQSNTLIETLKPILPCREANDTWDVGAVAGLLLERLESGLASDYEEDPEFPLQTPADLLALIVLSGEELPELAREEPDPEVNQRLSQLKAVAAEAVDSDHAKRESSVIRGLLQSVPYHTIKTIVESERLPSSTSAMKLIDFTSHVNQDLRFDKDPAPSVDPILLLATLAELTGKSEEQDMRIRRLFQPSNHVETRLFYRHIEDALETEFIVRDIAIKYLVRMRDLAKSDELRNQINELLPPNA